MRVVLVVGMVSDKVPHPSCGCNKFASRTSFDKVQIRRDAFHGHFITIYMIEVCPNQWEESWKVVTLSTHYFCHCHLFESILLSATRGCGRSSSLSTDSILVNFLHLIAYVAINVSVGGSGKHGGIPHTIAVITFLERGHVPAEKEFTLCGCVSTVSPLHIGINPAQWNVQIQIERQNNTCQQHGEDRERSIFKIGKLHLHASELSPPTDVRGVRAVPRRRRLPSHGLPERKN